MPGPPPKPASIRQRRNKEITAAELIDSSPLALGKPPPLRKRVDELGHRIPWSREVRRWWREIWSSPMAKEWTSSDGNGLIMLAVLREKFGQKPSAALSAEIRLQEARFGLDPTSRRRLQWQLKREQSPAPAGEAVPTPPPAAQDPRKLLRAVK